MNTNEREFTVHYTRGIEHPFTLAALEENGYVKVGIALVNEHDVYHRKRGRTIALGRARKRPLSEFHLEGRKLRDAMYELGENIANDPTVISNIRRSLGRK